MKFNQRGLLVPNKAILTNLMEIETKLVTEPGTPVRKALFNQYLEYSRNLKELLQIDRMRQWIGGSFTIKNVTPRDIDLVTFIDYELVEKLGSKLEAYKSPSGLEL